MGKDAILIADDDDDVRAHMRVLLRKMGVEVIESEDGLDALGKMTDEVSIAIFDNKMPGLTGLECLKYCKKNFPEAQVLMLSIGGVNDAVAAMREGAFWYLQKPFEPDEFIELVKKAQEHRQLRVAQEQLLSVLSSPSLPSDLSELYLLPQEIEAQLNKVAALDCTVLITGETGTGKTTLARLIHQRSARAGGPFVSLSCAALPRDLLEAELFGYERGAFTGATKTRVGRFEIADHGTLFLDEIGDMALDLQPKLLTFLEDRTVYRIGSNRPKKVDLRIVAATLQDLHEMCGEKRFREDLYFRLKVFALEIPPLRERRKDLPMLIKAIVKKIGARYQKSNLVIDEKAVQYLLDYDWPGNIRELENCLERAIVLSADSRLTRDCLAIESNGDPSIGNTTNGKFAGVPLSQLEQEAIQQTLTLCGGNKKEAARLLQISEKSIYNKLQRGEKKDR